MIFNKYSMKEKINLNNIRAGRFSWFNWGQYCNGAYLELVMVFQSRFKRWMLRAVLLYWLLDGMPRGSHYLVLGCCNSIVCARGVVEYFWGIWKFKKLIFLPPFLEFLIIFGWRRCAPPIFINVALLHHLQCWKLLSCSICISIVLFDVVNVLFC